MQVAAVVVTNSASTRRGAVGGLITNMVFEDVFHNACPGNTLRIGGFSNSFLCCVSNIKFKDFYGSMQGGFNWYNVQTANIEFDGWDVQKAPGGNAGCNGIVLPYSSSDTLAGTGGSLIKVSRIGQERPGEYTESCVSAEAGYCR